MSWYTHNHTNTHICTHSGMAGKDQFELKDLSRSLFNRIGTNGLVSSANTWILKIFQFIYTETLSVDIKKG